MKKTINAFIFQFFMAWPVCYFSDNHIFEFSRIVVTALIGTILMRLFASRFIIDLI